MVTTLGLGLGALGPLPPGQVRVIKERNYTYMKKLICGEDNPRLTGRAGKLIKELLLMDLASSPDGTKQPCWLPGD